MCSITKTNSPSSFHHNLQRNKTHQKQKYIRCNFFGIVESPCCHQFSRIRVCNLHPQKTSDIVFRLHNTLLLLLCLPCDFLRLFCLHLDSDYYMSRCKDIKMDQSSTLWLHEKINRTNHWPHFGTHVMQVLGF